MHRILLATVVTFLALHAPNAGAGALLPTESSGLEWASSEGVALRLGGGALWQINKAQYVTFVHAYDAFSRAGPYHHWEVGYGDGPNQTYAGVRYQNSRNVDEFEAGVTMGTVFLAFGLGAIYDVKAGTLQAVTLRTTFPVLAWPYIFMAAATSRAEPPPESKD